MPGAWESLLQDTEVRRWFQGLALGSKTTAEERTRVLYRYCLALKCTPASLVEKGRTNRRGVEDDLQDFVAKMHLEGKSPGYAENYVKAVKSWLLHNEIALIRKIRLGDRGATPTLADERIPSRDELARILRAATQRGKVSISFCAFSGLRPEVIGNREGTDGLRMNDLPELRVENGRAKFERIPALVKVRRELSKVRRAYLTFLPAEGCEYLRWYLEYRLARGEVLAGDSPLVRAKPGFERKGRAVDSAAHGSPFIETQAVTKEIRTAMRLAGIPFRPYVLRSYFMTNMEMAEREGKITLQDRRLFAGRVSDIDRRYTTGKNVLPPDVIEALRRSYAASAPHVTTAPEPSFSEDKVMRLAAVVLEDPSTRKAFEAALRTSLQQTFARNLGTYEGKRKLLRETFDGAENLGGY